MQERMDLPAIALSDFICPITSLIFFEPKQVLPCTHLFEEDAILEWLKTSGTCPCCRRPIENIGAATTVFNNQLTELIKKNPQLQDEQYFNLQTFLDELQLEANTSRFKKIIDFLKSSKHLNVVSDEKNFAGSTAAFFLCATNKGQELLKTDPQLRSKITDAGLDATYCGRSAIYWLLKWEHGIGFLIDHPAFRDKIPAAGLNHIAEYGEYRGLSAIYWLVRCETGRELLKNDPVLRAKITAEGLNGIKQEGMLPGDSAISWLAGNDNGIEIFQKDPIFRAKITSQGLNSYQLSGMESGISGTAYLIINKVGLKLLQEDVTLRNKITADGLNAMEQGTDEGASALYWLVKSSRGRKILLEDDRMRAMISPDALNRVLLDGEDKGKSAAYWLHHYGKDILAKDPVLRSKMRGGTHSLPVFFHLPKKDAEITSRNLENKVARF